MESATISAACTALIANIGNISIMVGRIVSCQRRARKDMDALSRDISSLRLCLETLHDDSTKVTYPKSMRRNLIEIIGNCEGLVAQLLELLQILLSDDPSNRSEWTSGSRDHINSLKSRIEIHKSALDIALDISSVLPAAPITDRIEDIQSSPAEAEQNVERTLSMVNDDSQIANVVEEIGLLRVHVSNLEQHDRGSGAFIERFLNESESFAISVGESQSARDLDPQHGADSPRRIVSEEGLERARTAPGLSRLDDENDQVPASDEDRSHFTDATSNASTSATKPSSEQVLPQTGDQSRESVHPRLQDVIGHGWNRSEYASTKAVRRKPVSYYSAPEVDLRGTQNAPRLEHATGDARILQHDRISNDLVNRSLPLEFSTNPLPQIRSSLVQPDDAPLIPVEPKQPRGKVDRSAIHAAGAKWAKLPTSKQLKLSKHFETLIRGKRDYLQSRVAWMSDRVGSYEDIKKALDEGARPNSSWGNDKDGFPLDPLVTEMRNAKRTDVIELLLSRGARADNLDKILIAASCDYKVFVELLLDYGADVEARDRPNNSPLNYAAELGSFQMVKLLLDRGADVNGRAGRFGTALQAASHQGNLTTVQHLLDHGAAVNTQGGFYGNALQAACWWRHSMVVQLLLEDGADVNALGQYGTALRAARVSNARSDENQTRQTINVLIAYGAVDEKRKEKDLEIRPMLPPRPSVSSASSGQSPMLLTGRWA